MLKELIDYMEQYYPYDNDDIADQVTWNLTYHPKDIMKLLLEDYIDGKPEAKPLLIHMLENNRKEIKPWKALLIVILRQ